MMEIISNFNSEEIKSIFLRGWQDLISTDFYQVKYSDADFAIRVGIILSLFVLLKILFTLIGRWLGWENYSRKDSGHFISGDYCKPFWVKCLTGIPALILSVSLTAILFAIANPYLPITKEEKKYIETITRMDLRDVSGSMIYKFQKTDKSKAEIASNAHLKFLEMRKGKNDRTAFWLFSDDPYPIQEDFIVDDEAYYFKVYDAPWEFGGANVDSWTDEQWQKYTIPKSRYLKVEGQGGTQLSKTLKLAIHKFDEDERRQKSAQYQRLNASRAILIVTDADISDFNTVKADLMELGKRRIKPYIIYIPDYVSAPQQLDEDEGGSVQQPSTPLLLQEVISQGGKYFSITDLNALDEAYREIDRLEKARTEIVKKSLKIPAFQKFIFLAILILIIVIPIGSLVQLLNYP